MGEIVELNPSQHPDSVLKLAVGAYKEVLILGYNHDGYLEVRASADMAAKSELLFLVETFKNALMNGAYDDDE